MNQVLPFEEHDWKAIEPYLSIVGFDEGEQLLRPPQICGFIAFIKSGSIRSYHTNDQLVETNLLLRSENEFITDYESFIREEPATLSIQGIEKGEAIFLDRTGLNALYETSFYWNKFGRIISEQIFVNSKRRTEQLLFLNPRERYLLLMKEHPDYFQKYSLKHIASYLGITPQSLSRIRNQLSRH
ncbi:Crp/Fnr family transcriptional regulator [Zobellia galactanivorans]|uniref:Crp/Fnr-type transcriptional regulator n=1 Tax=Zobellia galactanivorans (strain DSM 12802 / CCUG 47099 / CIP 106680 / NCIMB 13871 / Dsij) TaxID=63186 RepID=G0LA42_ZOBGA|nr:Crp/Fnr family transcriptional regulator [Zobellia galactanivorans]CAZ95033.1 Crp/Fnr-type transcriptional regulator [Zobellia galactanivorans]